MSHPNGHGRSSPHPSLILRNQNRAVLPEIIEIPIIRSNGGPGKTGQDQGRPAAATGVRPVRVLNPVGDTRDQGVGDRVLAPGVEQRAPHLHKRGNHFDRLIVMGVHLTSSGRMAGPGRPSVAGTTWGTRLIGARVAFR
jgi:hypothetical protein